MVVLFSLCHIKPYKTKAFRCLSEEQAVAVFSEQVKHS